MRRRNPVAQRSRKIRIFHILLATEGLPLIIAALFLFLLWRYWAAFAVILRP